ncbi:HNH endonuclease [Aeribacillus pallidus]|uniref:HNH domain-containing protein n=1 Tax=Aeribacillus pallidus TaxID=33936 RepID=A0A223E822_9BACI|nr:HNH endonuclease [Aeribacillus pallidus]ASS91392.1 hypothetical protein AP3564_15250 [Aeribacillus pallidus]
MKIYKESLNISVRQWLELLRNKEIFHEEDVELMMMLYYQTNCKATGKQLANLLNKKSHSVLNLQIGRLGKRIVSKLQDVQFPRAKDGTTRYWHIPFLGEEDRNTFIWQLRPELKEAISIYEKVDLNDKSQETLLPQELENIELYEGSKKLVAVNRYERNPKARQLCLLKYGYQCSVCEFDFEQFYGEIGKKFIEVHHIKPLSEINEEYRVNPFDDLRPVCPNCHAMLHKANVSIEELRRIIQKNHQQR